MATQQQAPSRFVQVAGRPVKPLEALLFPLYQRPMFPGMMISLILRAERMSLALEEIKNNRNGLAAFVLTRKEEPEEILELADFFRVGVLGRILRVAQVEENGFQILLRFESRLRLERFVRHKPFLVARISYFNKDEEGDILANEDLEMKGYLSALMASAREIISLNSIFAEEMKIFIGRSVPSSPALFINQIPGHLMSISRDELQTLLEIHNFKERLIRTLHFMHKEVEVLRVQKEISESVEKKVSTDQRKFFLQEQLKYIKKELGLERDEHTLLREKMLQRVKEIKLSQEAKKVVEEEMGKLALYSPQSSEYAVSKNYLDNILSLPWGLDAPIHTKSFPALKRSLDKNHYGMKEVKARVLEFLAVERLKGESAGSILCLLGPPGVGKTSLAKSMAIASNREFFRFSLGGMRDEAEIKGHRRTYVGALPGKIIQALKNKKSRNLLIVLDEIDKMAVSYQGDPASALLEVLDPEQNAYFRDHYLDLSFDISKIFFVTTANSLHNIPRPLLDRMEVIEVSGYTDAEKMIIAKRHLLPRLEKQNGLRQNTLRLESKVVEKLLSGYARESGLRSLEKMLGKLCRKIAFNLVMDKDGKQPKTLKKSKKIVVIDELQLQKYLGKTIFRDDDEIADHIGVVCGLAWTELGGSTLYIEAMAFLSHEPSREELRRQADAEASLHTPMKPWLGRRVDFRLTGNAGNVMQESAMIALSAARRFLRDYSMHAGEERKFSNKAETSSMAASYVHRLEQEIHLHIPAGAVPKDGPSAGVAMASALLSLALQQSMPAHTAMTGELTLSGAILPVGGIREKLIAAARAGKKNVFLPKANKVDYDEIPAKVRASLRPSFVGSLNELVELLFPSLQRAKKRQRKSKGKTRIEGSVL